MIKHTGILLLLFSLLTGCNDKPEEAIIPSTTKVTVSIYPNPATDAADVVVHAEKPYTVRAFDSYGNLIAEAHNQSHTSVHVSDKPKGYYEVVVTTAETTVVKTLLKL